MQRTRPGTNFAHELKVLAALHPDMRALFIRPSFCAVGPIEDFKVCTWAKPIRQVVIFVCRISLSAALDPNSLVLPSPHGAVGLHLKLSTAVVGHSGSRPFAC